MSILVFHDLDGDLVAFDASAIVALRKGKVDGQPGAVTLVTVPGVTVIIREPADEVLAIWREARGEVGRRADVDAHPGVFPLVEHQYPVVPPIGKSGRRKP